MPKLESRPEVSKGAPKQYALTPERVFDLSRHYFTAEEICDCHNLRLEDFLAEFGVAFHAGKEDALQKPRMLKRDCAILLQGFVDGYKEMTADGTKLQSNEAADIRKIYEVMSKAETAKSQQKLLDGLTNPLSQLSDEALKAKLEAAGYIKKDQA